MAGVEFLWSMFKDLCRMLRAARIDAEEQNVQAATKRRTTLSREVDRGENLRQVSIRQKQNVSL